ncbi:MAG: DUF503 domain-containing protein [Deferrisomatales bacterium]
MVVGVATIDLYLPEARSLKDKRGVVRRVIDRTRNQFGVSVAEVDHLDLHQTATIGIAVVTNDSRLADSLLNRILDFVEGTHLAQITRTELEILHV